jgi:hypothetical protein
VGTLGKEENQLNFEAYYETKIKKKCVLKEREGIYFAMVFPNFVKSVSGIGVGGGGNRCPHPQLFRNAAQAESCK